MHPNERGLHACFEMDGDATGDHGLKVETLLRQSLPGGMRHAVEKTWFARSSRMNGG